MPRTELSSHGSAMLRRFTMVVVGELRDAREVVVQNAHAHVLPSYGRMAFALLPDGSLSP